ncbi:serine/threonine/tyrosine-interacting-like protein 1 [Tympanuchus pallidicinctus]|uniref:serine/threonine/tyrosine-interacting-like protein 1 n=1 Tax=Tympanuchus pallidicinctus TaxID=109042 RepID=UPI00228741F9|nr:serine/threonine/tyrosine-interacting-like protein 1 [Tympanuchus pallidicinctus]
MAGVMLCEPTELYNILNQHRRFPRLSEPNYLILLDARTLHEYNESHIITARRIEQELNNFQPYPVEILPGKLYMGNFKQACDQQIQKDLKIKARVNISEQPATLWAEEGKYLHISVPDSLEADLFSSFSTICHFIDTQLDLGAVLVFSSLGISRSSTVTMAYLMHSFQFSLKKAWNHVLKCKTNVRPHRGFVKQLSDWEAQIYGTTITDVSEPNY